jgi:hypothetical protein
VAVVPVVPRVQEEPPMQVAQKGHLVQNEPKERKV